MKTFVFNGWAADPAIWNLTTFAHERIFNYIEELQGVHEKVLANEECYVLVGFSMGGTFALQTALAQPDKVRGLVLISATARMMEQRDEGWDGMSLRRRQALMLGTQMMHPGDQALIYDETWMRCGLDYLQNTDIRSALQAGVSASENLRRIPVAIFQSERDGIVRPSNALFLKSVFPQADLTLVPGNEHTLPLVSPDMIDAAVTRILRTLETAFCGGGMAVRTSPLARGA